MPLVQLQRLAGPRFSGLEVEADPSSRLANARCQDLDLQGLIKKVAACKKPCLRSFYHLLMSFHIFSINSLFIYMYIEVKVFQT